jgi:MFS family permease
MSKAQSLRQSLSFVHGNFLVLTIVAVIGQFARSMVFPYASLYILALGGEPAQVGLINSLMPLAGLFLFPIAGYLSDLTGRVKMVAFASYFSGAILLLYIVAPSWHLLIWAALLRGLLVLQFPPSSAILADSLSPECRGIGMATMNTASNLLALVSPYLGGALLDAVGVELGMRILYGIMMVLYLANATINLAFLKETARPSHHSFGLGDLPLAFRQAYGGIPETLRTLPRSLKALAGIIVLSFVSNAIAGPFWVVYAREVIGFSSAEWGLILLLETALRIVSFLPAGMLVDRYGRTRFLLISLVLTLASVPFFVLSTNFTQVLLIRCAVAMATALFMPSCSALMADMVPRKNRGRVMAALGRGTVMIGAASGGTGGPGVGFLVTLPLMVASLLGGYVYASNPAYPWYLTVVTTALSIVLCLAFVRDPKTAEV